MFIQENDPVLRVGMEARMRFIGAALGFGGETNLVWLLSLLFGLAAPAAALMGGTPARIDGIVSYGECTGALIAPNLILTSGHCLLGPTENGAPERLTWPGKTLQVYSHNGSDYAGGRKRFVTQIARWAVHPSWLDGIKKYRSDAAITPGVSDVGVIELRDQLDLPLAEIADQESVAKYDWIEIYGAGCQKRYGQTLNNHTLKGAEVQVRALTPARVLVATYDRRTDKAAGLCKGDSGGPAIKNGKIVALNSVLTKTPTTKNTKPIQSYLARIDRPEVQTWLVRALATPARGPQALNREPQSAIEALTPFLQTVTAAAVLLPKMRQEPRLHCRSEHELRLLADQITRSPKGTRLSNLLSLWATCPIAQN